MREWGTLRALGTKKRDILFVILWEGCLQGLVGAAAGTAFGFLVSAIINAAAGFTTTTARRCTASWRAAWTPCGSTSSRLSWSRGSPRFPPGIFRAVRFTPSECLREV